MTTDRVTHVSPDLPAPVVPAAGNSGVALSTPQPLPLPGIASVGYHTAKIIVGSPKAWPDAANMSRHIYTIVDPLFGPTLGHTAMQVVAGVEVWDQGRLMLIARRGYSKARDAHDTAATAELGIKTLAFFVGMMANLVLLTYVVGGLAKYKLPDGRTLKEVLAPSFKVMWTSFLALAITGRFFSIYRSNQLIRELEGVVNDPAEVRRLMEEITVDLAVEAKAAAGDKKVQRRPGRLDIGSDIGINLTKDVWDVVKPRLKVMTDHGQHPEALQLAILRLKQNKWQTGVRILAAAAALGGQWWLGDQNRYWLVAALGTNTLVLMWQAHGLGQDQAVVAAQAKAEKERARQQAAQKAAPAT